IGQDLGVRYLVQGRVEKRDDSLRATVRLIDAASGAQSWSRSYDLPSPDNFLDAENEMSDNIAGALLGDQGAINREARNWVLRKPPANFTAFDYYLKAMPISNDPSSQDIEDSIQNFKKALSLDSGLARAYVGLAWMAQLKISLGYT